MEVDIKKALKAFAEARDRNDSATMETLKSLFGEKICDVDVKVRVGTFKDACLELGHDHPYTCIYRDFKRIGYETSKDVEAYLKLRIICAALNEGWKPQFTDDEEWYYPVFRIYKNEDLKVMEKGERDRLYLEGSVLVPNNGLFAFVGSISSFPERFPSFGWKFVTKSEELACYFGKQFTDIWVDYLVR